MSGWRIAAMAALALAGGAVLEPVSNAQTEPSVSVELTPLAKGSLRHIVRAYGSVQPSEAAQHAVTASASAIVRNIDVREGEAVTAGTPLIELAPSPQAMSAYTQAQTALRVAQDLVARTRIMVGQHLATRQQLADAEKSAADAQAALAALQAQGAGGTKILRAPGDAIVTVLSTSPGAFVTEGTTLLQLASPDALVLKVGVVPAEAGEIAAGDAVSITPLGSRSFSGKVALRGSVVDAADGLVPVEITLPAGKALPGEMAVAAITTGTVPGYVVPHVAILVDDSGNPYVVQAIDGTAKQVPVRILDTSGDEDVIDGALDVSAPVVLAGNHQLENGMKIRIADPPKAGP